MEDGRDDNMRGPQPQSSTSSTAMACKSGKTQLNVRFSSLSEIALCRRRLCKVQIDEGHDNTIDGSDAQGGWRGGYSREAGG